MTSPQGTDEDRGGASAPRLTFADGGEMVLPWFRQMRESEPVWFDDTNGTWSVFRYDDIVRVLRDPDTFSSDPSSVMPEEAVAEAEGNMVSMDPPQHGRLRGLVSEAFTPRLVERLAERVREISDELIGVAMDGGPATGTLDVIGDVAYRLPVVVIGELLGLPSADHDYLVRSADELYAISGADPFDGSYLAAMQSTLDELNAYMLEQAEHRRRQPGTDLMTALALAEIDGQRLSDREIRNFAVLLLTGGHITTTALLGNTVLALGEHPDVRARWRTGEVATAAVMEEVLRHRTPFTEVYRFTTAETDLGGVTVPAGALLRAWIVSGNRDERQFTDPDSFVLHRRSGRHLGFGLGAHYCLGANLARMETTVALDVLARRTAEFTPAVDELEYYDAPGIFCLRGLPVSYIRADR